MNRKRKRRGTALALIAMSAVLSGCSVIFPPEEEERLIPLVETAEELDYSVESVMVGDVVESTYIRVVYQQSQDENLSFPVEGTVRKILVSTGQQVHAGDVLAQLDVGDTEEQLSELEKQMEKDQKEKNDLLNLKQYDLNDLALKYQAGYYDGWAEYSKAVSDLDRNYSSRIGRIDDSLTIGELKKAKYEKILEESRLVAGMDGTVSFIQSGLKGRSVKAGAVVMTIIDSTECVFSGTTEYMDRFQDGEILEIECNDTMYEVTVKKGKDLGNGIGEIFFDLVTPDSSLSFGVQGTYELVLNRSEDTLYVSRKCIHDDGNGNYYVYQINDDGVRGLTYIKVGITGGNYTEILEGLKAGDLVISR